jgi:uncharacterized membrane protein
MKKVFMTLALLLTIAGGIQAAGQEELQDSTNKDAIELYSDTTSTSQTATAADDSQDDTTVQDPSPLINQWINKLDSNDIAGMLFVLAIIFIIFVLAPVLIIIALFYFLHKNRKEKMRLAQMAVQQGQPIPDRLLEDRTENTDDEYQKGMRQCFVGVGLMIFLGYAAGQVGFGIGALVFCIGLGKVFASRTAKRTDDLQDRHTGR